MSQQEETPPPTPDDKKDVPPPEKGTTTTKTGKAPAEKKVVKKTANELRQQRKKEAAEKKAAEDQKKASKKKGKDKAPPAPKSSSSKTSPTAAATEGEEEDEDKEDSDEEETTDPSVYTSPIASSLVKYVKTASEHAEANVLDFTKAVTGQSEISEIHTGLSTIFQELEGNAGLAKWAITRMEPLPLDVLDALESPQEEFEQDGVFDEDKLEESVTRFNFQNVDLDRIRVHFSALAHLAQEDPEQALMELFTYHFKLGTKIWSKGISHLSDPDDKKRIVKLRTIFQIQELPVNQHAITLSRLTWAYPSRASQVLAKIGMDRFAPMIPKERLPLKFRFPAALSLIEEKHGVPYIIWMSYFGRIVNPRSNQTLREIAVSAARRANTRGLASIARIAMGDLGEIAAEDHAFA